jgi:hypothetical protein
LFIYRRLGRRGKLNIQVKSQRVSAHLAEMVSIPVKSRSHYAQKLASAPSASALLRTATCVFSQATSSRPEMVSAAHGVVTFTRVSDFPMLAQQDEPADDEWHIAVHPHGIQLGFDPRQVCTATVWANWAHTTLTVTIHTDTALSQVTHRPLS